MNILCVYPAFPTTYWGHEYTLALTGRRALLPPLGLLTVAALVPDDWDVHLCDMNVRPLDDAEIDAADAVFISAMIIQRASAVAVAQRARARGRIVVAGGPLATSSPDELAPYVDCVVAGEAEELIAPLCAALARGRQALPPRFEASRRPEMSLVPIPRYDLLDARAYNSIGVQWSRGCPFNCEFCDIIEVFGRRPRTKTPAQLCRELDAIHATGFRGSVFLVDDNFIGNKVEAMRLLGPLRDWSSAHGRPFSFYTEASVNLAACDDLIDAMVAAGIGAVFLGIETPSKTALRATNKAQNLAVDLDAAVAKLISRGLEVWAGFIVGFDTDDADALEALRRWILDSPIPQAMVGILTAIPNTQLARRLASEGRMRTLSTGDNVGQTNFQTTMDELDLLEGYARLLRDAYQPDAFFGRAARALRLRPRADEGPGLPWPYALRCAATSLVRQGLFGRFRRAYWRFLGQVLRSAPRRLPRAIALAMVGEHMIRYTAEDVLPRLERAIAERRAAPQDRCVAA